MLTLFTFYESRWQMRNSKHEWSKNFLSISAFVRHFSWNVEKTANSTVLNSFLKTFLPSRDSSFAGKTTNLQVIQNQYISPVWCLITIVARIESFPGVRSCRDLFAIALDFEMNCRNAILWSVLLFHFAKTARRSLLVQKLSAKISSIW